MKWANNIYDGEKLRVPIKSWCEFLEKSMRDQIVQLANHPLLYHHMVLLPDAHLGFGMPIGGVIACDSAVIPNAVGSDVGCGMIAVKTNYPYKYVSEEDIKEIMGKVRKVVPTGFKHHNDQQEWDKWEEYPVDVFSKKEVKRAKHQMGSLGSGNHFLEIQKGDDGFIWLMIHSGSRNFGYKHAKKYNDKAIELCENWKSDIPNKELAFLPIDTVEAQEYLIGMNYCLDFAYANRQLMMKRFKESVDDVLKCCFIEEINIHHNFASIEHHFNKNIWIHRKGATQAKEGQKGIIPGSMGTPSYIVQGLGNKESFESCSHGAGRNMSRTQASKTLSVEDCDKDMEGVVFGRWGKDRKGRIDLGEAPQAYKDIDEVIEAQLDLITPLVKLQPLGVIKG